MAIQRRTSFRKTPNWGGENPPKISRSSTSHCGKSSQSQNRRFGQEKVFGTQRPHGRTILLFDPKKDQFEARRCFILLCEQCNSPDLRNYGIPLPRASWRRLFPLHRVLRRKCLRKQLGWFVHIFFRENGAANSSVHQFYVRLLILYTSLVLSCSRMFFGTNAQFLYWRFRSPYICQFSWNRIVL